MPKRNCRGCCKLHVCFQTSDPLYCKMLDGATVACKYSIARQRWEGSGDVFDYITNTKTTIQVRIVKSPTWQVSWTCDDWVTSDSYDFGTTGASPPSDPSPYLSIESGGCCNGRNVRITVGSSPCLQAFRRNCFGCLGTVPGVIPQAWPSLFVTVSGWTVCGLTFDGTFPLRYVGDVFQPDNVNGCAWLFDGPVQITAPSICSFGADGKTPCSPALSISASSSYGINAAGKPVVTFSGHAAVSSFLCAYTSAGPPLRSEFFNIEIPVDGNYDCKNFSASAPDAGLEFFA